MFWTCDVLSTFPGVINLWQKEQTSLTSRFNCLHWLLLAKTVQPVRGPDSPPQWVPSISLMTVQDSPHQSPTALRARLRPLLQHLRMLLASLPRVFPPNARTKIGRDGLGMERNAQTCSRKESHIRSITKKEASRRQPPWAHKVRRISACYLSPCKNTVPKGPKRAAAWKHRQKSVYVNLGQTNKRLSSQLFSSKVLNIDIFHFGIRLVSSLPLTGTSRNTRVHVTHQRRKQSLDWPAGYTCFTLTVTQNVHLYKVHLYKETNTKLPSNNISNFHVSQRALRPKVIGIFIIFRYLIFDLGNRRTRDQTDNLSRGRKTQRRDCVIWDNFVQRINFKSKKKKK